MNKQNHLATSNNSNDQINLLMKEYYEYTLRWTTNSNYFASQSLYSWMAEKVKGKERILEVGCGVGVSTQTLLNEGHIIVALDENPECICAAHERVIKSYEAEKFIRANRLIIDGEIETAYADIDIKNNTHKALFVESNIATDACLESQLPEMSMDGVVCWLIGTHWKNREYDRNMKLIDAINPEVYRNSIHELIFQKADKFLKPDGVIHIVDRGTRCIDDDQIQSFTQFYSFLARGTGFELSNYDQFHYDGSEISKGVLMGAKGKSLKKSELQKSALHSILFTKVI